jgi:serine/threonine protein kinase
MVIEGGKTELSEVTFPGTPVVSEEAKTFILNMLDREPNCRMDMDEAIHHPFLRDVDL